jgi:catechol 2,3-dioxygenase-like lactoylglutathione lyase family enzyme
MLDHISFVVSDFDRSKQFYVAALAPLSVTLLMEFPAPDGSRNAGFGEGDKPYFWIGTGARPLGGTHVAFVAPSAAEVEAFYRAALAAGGRDNGAPGPRPHYHQNYYGAFVYDPDGNNVEAVIHNWQGAAG